MNADDPDTPTDVNEVVVAEWIEETTPEERVRSVLRTTHRPIPLEEIAALARTNPDITAEHVETLLKNGFVETATTSELEEPHYYRSPQSLIADRALDILNDVGRDELESAIREMRETIATYQQTTGAETPNEARQMDNSLSQDDLCEWRTTRRNLQFSQVALAISESATVLDEMDRDQHSS